MGTDLDFGKIGCTDRGDWSASYNSGQGYEYLDGVTKDNCYWISLDNQNTETPSDSATKWHKALNGKADQANTAAQGANSAAQAANEAAQAALDAVVTAELPAVATESNVRNIVKNYTQNP